MSETLPNAPVEQLTALAPEPGVLDLRDTVVEQARHQTIGASQEVLEHEASVQNTEVPNREQILRTLLGTDYEFAVDSGLLDIFEGPNEGKRDALLHILVGDISVNNENGSLMPGGFHHEPSAYLIHSNTQVNHELNVGINASRRKTFEQREFEPWRAPGVTIDGYQKVNPDVDPVTGEAVLLPARNTMFPNEYDALAVIQTINRAVESLDKSTAVSRGGVTQVVGEAPAIDNEGSIKVMLYIDEETGKVVSAHPQLKGRIIQTQSKVEKTIQTPHFGGVDRLVTKLPESDVNKMLGL